MRRFVPLALATVLLLSGCGIIITDAMLKDRIREAVREDPALVMDALDSDKVTLLHMVEQGAQERREQAMFDKWQEQLGTPFEPAIDDNRPMLGADGAPVTIVGYTDFQCGYCARGAVMVKSLIEQYPGRIRYFAKHAPMSEVGEYAARVFESVALQSPALAWEFYAKAFEAQSTLGQSPDPKMAYLSLASTLVGIDAQRLGQDMESEAVKATIREDAREFLGWGFRGVPVYLYNGVAVEGAMPRETLERVLDMVDDTQAKTQAPSPQGDAYSLDETGACTDCLSGQ